LNFKEPEAVRALTCTLLKEDFGLTIAIPLERLIPTVPLRLNYIHWVEDLTGGQGQPRKGIDIGGSCTTQPSADCPLGSPVGTPSA
jgi:methyltransferase